MMLTLPSNARCGLCNALLGLGHLGFRGFRSGSRGLLCGGCLFSLLSFLGSPVKDRQPWGPENWTGSTKALPDGLFALSLPDLGFLVPLGEDVAEGGADDGPLELGVPLGALLGGFLLGSLPVLPPVEDGPPGLPGVPLQKVSLHRPSIQELENLTVGFDQGPAAARVDFVAAVRTDFDPARKIQLFSPRMKGIFEDFAQFCGISLTSWFEV